MARFKVNDRVICLSPWDGNDSIVSKVGTVVANDNWSSNVSVQFDENIRGHSADGRGKNGYCWGIPDQFLIPYVDGKETPDLIYADSWNFKVLDKVIIRQKKLIPKPTRKYYVIGTLYKLIRKDRRRHYRMFETDKTFKEVKRSIDTQFASVDEAKEFLKIVMGGTIK